MPPPPGGGKATIADLGPRRIEAKPPSRNLLMRLLPKLVIQPAVDVARHRPQCMAQVHVEPVCDHDERPEAVTHLVKECTLEILDVTLAFVCLYELCQIAEIANET